MLSVFGKGRTRVETKTAVLGVRGTGVYIEAEPERTYICVCYGKIELTARATGERNSSAT